MSYDNFSAFVLSLEMYSRAQNNFFCKKYIFTIFTRIFKNIETLDLVKVDMGVDRFIITNINFKWRFPELQI